MPMHRCLILIATLLFAGPAAAQMTVAPPPPGGGFGPAPSQGGFQAPPAQGGFQPPPQQQQQQEPPCFKEFMALRGEAEKRGKALQAAGQRKVKPVEACRLFNDLQAAEVKLIKYAETNASWCGIPTDLIKQMKDGHSKVMEIRTRVCQAAAQPQRAPGPTLGEALGANRVPDASNIKSGKGTYDTLTGTPLGGTTR